MVNSYSSCSAIAVLSKGLERRHITSSKTHCQMEAIVSGQNHEVKLFAAVLIHNLGKMLSGPMPNKSKDPTLLRARFERAKNLMLLAPIFIDVYLI